MLSRRTALAAALCSLPCLAQTTQQTTQQATPAEPALEPVLARILSQIEVLKPGMTRSALGKVFRTEGGLSTRGERRFVLPTCGLIKVRVTFRLPEGQHPETWEQESQATWGQDLIETISQPFLEREIMD